eukprot:scaffold666_cov332-Prasinococcus_capsulatus_cf.AAC.5
MSAAVSGAVPRGIVHHGHADAVQKGLARRAIARHPPRPAQVILVLQQLPRVRSLVGADVCKGRRKALAGVVLVRKRQLRPGRAEDGRRHEVAIHIAVQAVLLVDVLHQLLGLLHIRCGHLVPLTSAGEQCVSLAAVAEDRPRSRSAAATTSAAPQGLRRQRSYATRPATCVGRRSFVQLESPPEELAMWMRHGWVPSSRERSWFVRANIPCRVCTRNAMPAMLSVSRALDDTW